MIFFKPTRHLSGAIVERLKLDLGMTLERYISLYKETPANREVMKELGAIFFRLPPGDQVFKINSAMPECELLPLVMSILVCPGFWDVNLSKVFKDKILSRLNKPLRNKRLAATAAAKYPDMSWETHADLFRFLIVRLPIYTSAKAPERITSEELPDFLDSVGAAPLLKRYCLDELLLAFLLLGYPVYPAATGDGWNVGLQVLGTRVLANSLSTRHKVGNAEIDAMNNFDSTKV